MRLNDQDGTATLGTVDQFHSPTEWLRRFASCLMLLHPETIAFSAACHVAASRPDAYTLDPEEAASQFVFEAPPVEAISHH